MMIRSPGNQYLHDVSTQLLGSRREKEKLLRELRIRIDELSSCTDRKLNYQDFVLQFGTPAEIADSLLQQSNPASIRRQWIRNRNWICISLVLMFLILTSLGFAILQDLNITQELASGYAVETLYDSPVHEPPNFNLSAVSTH